MKKILFILVFLSSYIFGLTPMGHNTWYHFANGGHKYCYQITGPSSSTYLGSDNSNSFSLSQLQSSDKIWNFVATHYYFTVGQTLSLYSLVFYNYIPPTSQSLATADYTRTDYPAISVDCATVPSPAPTCPSNSHLDTTTNKCVADAGYHMDGNVSKSDVTCPPSMKYYYKAAPWYRADIKTCIADSDISKAACLKIPGSAFTSSNIDFGILNIIRAGSHSGCYDKNYYTHSMIAQVIGFNPFGSLATQPDLLGSFVSKIFNWGSSKVKFAGKKLWSSITNKFKGTNKTFFDTQAEVIDMQVGDDGVTYEVATTPKTPTPPPTSNGWRDVYDNYINNGWSFPTAKGDVSPDVPDLKINDVKFPTDPNPNAFYNVGDNIGFQDSAIVTANSIKDHVVPDLTPFLNTPPLKPFSVHVPVKPDFLRNLPPTDYPANFTLIKTVDRGGGVLDRTFKGNLPLSDGSSVNYKIVKTSNPDGSGVDDVVVSHSVNTKNGVKVFTNNYSNVFNSSGHVTSSVDNSSYVSYTDNSGHVVTTNNYSNSLTTDSSSAIDLTPTNAKLDSINLKLNDISSKIDDMIKFRPADATNAEASLNNFKTAADLFDVNFNTYFDFVKGLKANVTLITTQFNNAKAVLSNKPTINPINGQCGFDVVMYSKPFHVDPCAFVMPYRPLLSLFFTMFMTYAVLLFAVKYLIAGGKD